MSCSAGPWSTGRTATSTAPATPTCTHGCPAELLLVYVSIFAAAILLFNIRRQGWTLPVLAVGIWAFVALVVGIIYPALLQALKVNPAQSSLEAPYIQRNITATRDAYDVNHVEGAVSSRRRRPITPSQTVINADTINNIRQWDPDPSISLETFQRLQGIKSYYTFPSLGRRPLRARWRAHTRCSSGCARSRRRGLVSQTWVNTHLQYTHGNGAGDRTGQPDADHQQPGLRCLAGAARPRRMGLPKITQPDVYFGLGESGYVVANTKQAEVDYQQPNGNNVESHYKRERRRPAVDRSSRGPMFALRLGDFNLLISSQITDKSRIMFVRDPLAMAQKAAPFLSFDHDPYAVIYKRPHRLDRRRLHDDVELRRTRRTPARSRWPIGSTLPSSYNYVRNSVKVVVNAYTGQMTFYDIDPSDPILQAYSAAFPHMFVPISDDAGGAAGPSALPRGHLLRPVRHLRALPPESTRQQFYAASNAWQLSPTAGAGPQSQALLAQNTYNNQGQLVSTTPARMSPQYQVYSLPGTDPTNPANQVFTISDGFVPATQSSGSSIDPELQPHARGWWGMSDPAHYGQLKLYDVPQGTVGPANADAEIQADNNVSSDITLLNQHGSQVLLGETLMVPIADSMVYIRPLYVAATTRTRSRSSSTSIAVLGGTVKIDTSLSAVLATSRM